MRLIGLIGGLSWESSAVYYRLINEGVRDRLGSPHSARILLWSFDFGEVERLQYQGDWGSLARIMAEAASRLEKAGAERILICSNTMHRVFEDVQSAVAAKLIHIADPTGEALVHNRLKHVCLLGTKFTMEADFYRERLVKHYGLSVLVPEERQRDEIHRIIYSELVAGKVVARSREAIKQIIVEMASQGAEAVILGCTELMLLVRDGDSPVPILDTTTLHARAAVEAAVMP